MTPAPKPPKPVRGSKEAKRHMAAVAQLACLVCGRYGVQVHHCIHGRFSQTKASDFDTLPLCADHHDELHAGKESWFRRRGWLDHEKLPQVARQVAEIRRNTIGGRP